MKFVKTARASHPTSLDDPLARPEPSSDVQSPGVESGSDAARAAPQTPTRKPVPKSEFPRMAMRYRATRSGRGVH